MCLIQLDMRHKFVLFVPLISLSVGCENFDCILLNAADDVAQSVSLATALLPTHPRFVISPVVKGRPNSQCVSTWLGLIPLFTWDVSSRTIIWSTFL